MEEGVTMELDADTSSDWQNLQKWEGRPSPAFWQSCWDYHSND
jgi:hypothetical protein